MRRLAPICLALLCAAGCTDIGDYQVVPSWLINSASPDRDRCQEQDIDIVRVTAEGPRGTRSYEAPCEQKIALVDGQIVGGLRTGFDFDYGSVYDLTIETLDRDDAVLDRFALELVEQFPVDATELTTVDVFQPYGAAASISGSWDLSGDWPADVCDDAGVSEVALWAAAANDMELEILEEVAWAPCSDGELDSVDAVLATGEYWVTYVALDERRQALSFSDAIAVSVLEAGEHQALPHVSLDL